MRQDEHYLSYLPPKELQVEIAKMIKNPTAYSEDDFIFALLMLSTNKIDFKLTDSLASFCIDSQNEHIKNMAVMAVSHIARVYKKLVNQELYSKIITLYLDESNPLSGQAHETLEDIQIFLKIPFPSRNVQNHAKK